jgi:RNA polymerase sigma factor (sigma-70 family)
MSGIATTRWSLILAARGTSGSARAALEELCHNYRPVVLAYFKRQEQPQLADDRTQAFFLHFLERHLHNRADADRGSFRAFLFTSVRNHWHEALRSESAQKRHAGLEAREDTSAELADAHANPEHQFDRDWALHVLRRAREQLRREAERSGKSTLYAAVQDFLLEPPENSDYTRIGAALAMPANTVAVAVRRLRERLRALVRRELADTLAPSADIDVEMHWLKQALRDD